MKPHPPQRHQPTTARSRMCRFNIGCARAIAKALKIERNEETEAETGAWEKGETE